MSRNEETGRSKSIRHIWIAAAIVIGMLLLAGYFLLPAYNKERAKINRLKETAQRATQNPGEDSPGPKTTTVAPQTTTTTIAPSTATTPKTTPSIRITVKYEKPDESLASSNNATIIFSILGLSLVLAILLSLPKQPEEQI